MVYIQRDASASLFIRAIGIVEMENKRIVITQFGTPDVLAM
ncbi:quinone oxidoreductase domain protein [Vibrio cholerae CP1047(20)]|nr:quinone oxidoreductase domain protein [Vibrio cholerae CP1047(20)]